MKILIVEDEYLVAEEIRICLRRSGFGETEHAATEKEALLRISDGGWDAAVVDANLNGRRMDSIAQSLLERHIPFIIVTGYGRSNLPDNVAGINIVNKPFRPQRLVEAVSSLLTESRY